MGGCKWSKLCLDERRSTRRKNDSFELFQPNKNEDVELAKKDKGSTKTVTTENQLSDSDTKTNERVLRELFEPKVLDILRVHRLSKHMDKTLGEIQKHYNGMLSIREHEFTPERLLMEAVVKAFQRHGWYVALFEYEIIPFRQSTIGKGDLLLVLPDATGSLIALAVEAKILSKTSYAEKRWKVYDQAIKYCKHARWLLSQGDGNVSYVEGLPVVAWGRDPGKFMILRGWSVSDTISQFLPTNLEFG